MLNKNYPGNESLTITLTDSWYFSKLYHICNWKIPVGHAKSCKLSKYKSASTV